MARTPPNVNVKEMSTITEHLFSSYGPANADSLDILLTQKTRFSLET
mgnify:CR=1 FL=1